MNLRRLIFIVLLFPTALFAQDPAYSQFFANPLHLNPAFAGTSELPRLVINYHNQWPQKGTTFSTYSVSYDRLVKNTQSGLGLQVYYDREANDLVNTSSGIFSYSHHVKLGMESFMTLGLQAGVILKQFDTGSLVFPSNINQISGTTTGQGIILTENESKLFPDFGVGMVGQYRSVFWGLSVQHLNRPDESIVEGDQKGRLPVKVTANAGSRLHLLHFGLLSREFSLSPNILYQQQGSFKQLNLGIYMIEKSILFGAWFRNNLDIRPDAAIALIGFARERFKFGYSFDYTLSKLSNYSHGSHEISLTFFITTKNKRIYHDKLLIPAI